MPIGDVGAGEGETDGDCIEAPRKTPASSLPSSDESLNRCLIGFSGCANDCVRAHCRAAPRLRIAYHCRAIRKSAPSQRAPRRSARMHASSNIDL